MNAIKVRYENGVFRPVRKTEIIEEGAEGEVHLQRKKKARPSVRASEFFGLWKTRKDIKDGLSYVRKLRSALFEIKELSEPIGEEAYLALRQYSKSHRLRIADALIAATAKADALELVSKNERHFGPIKGLKFMRANY